MCVLTLLVIGLVLFLGMHATSMSRSGRASLIARFGEGGFKAVYSLVSLIGLGLIVWGFGAYRAAGMIPLWNPPTWTRHLVVLLMLPVLPLLFSAYAQGFVKARLKHPMILAVKIWALGHLLANGDLGSVLLFGGFLLWSVIGFANMRRRPVDDSKAFVPNPGQDAAAVLGGLIVYGLMIGFLHRWLVGVGVFG
jgi:uncharacterized membrane protein